MNNVQKIISQMSAISARPLENTELIYKYIDDSLNKNIKITFYNWECPPRYLDQDKRGKKFLNYCVDLKLIAKGEKIDAFTEIPRVIEKADEEKKILEYLKSTNLKFRFVKIIADTNAFYITPESIARLGKNRILKAHNAFKQLVVKKIKQYPVPADVYLFTKLIKPLQTYYSKAYKKALISLNRNSNQLIADSVYNAQFARTKKHIGLTDNQQIKTFVNRTIATYAAEGMIFNKLSKTTYFSNCIWLNIEEVDQRTIEITNILRRKSGVSNLPMFFANMKNTPKNS